MATDLNIDALLAAEEELAEQDLKAHIDQIKHSSRIVFNWAQSDFFRAEAGRDELVASGGFRSGKTLALASKMYQYLCYPNTKILLTTRNYSDLKRSTLMTLLYGETMPNGEWRPPILPPQAIKTKDYISGFITLHTGSMILLSGCADETKCRSITVSGVFVEEATRISEEAFKELSARASQEHALGTRLYAACNPEHKGHWLYKRMVSERKPTRKMICLPTWANQENLPKGYIEKLSEMPEDDKKRLLDGEWLETAGGVFNHFSQTKNVASCRHLFTPEHMAEIVIGQDLGGGRQYAGFVLAGRGHDGKIYIGQEHQKKAILIRDMLNWQEQFRNLTNTVVYDKNNSQFGVSEMQNVGWTTIPSFNDIEASCSVVNNLFANGELIIDPGCNILIQEIENAYRNSETNRVVKNKDWDILDAARYSAYWLHDGNREQKQKKDFWWIG